MFRILESIELQGWREQTIDMPLEEQRYCPCDGTQLRTVAAVTGKKPEEIRQETGRNSAIVRIGCCPACGYMGYQDRPTAAWFADFYRSQWDQQAEDHIQLCIRERRQPGVIIEHHFSKTACERIPFQPQASVFEAGTGYADALEDMRRRGYRNVSGVEPSPHRAQVAVEGWGLNVSCEPIEAHQGGPYDVVLSHHVLEHCHDPAAVVRKLANLQPEGGYLVLAVPDNATEPTMGVLTFLPHLHSFTRRGLYWLLEDCGYTVLEQAQGDIFVLARKTGDGAYIHSHLTRARPHPDCFWAGEHKLRRSLVASARDGVPCWNNYGETDAFCWPMKSDVSWKVRMNEHPSWRTDWEQYKPRVLRVEPIQERRTDAPIEIQWEGPLRLYVK